MSGNDGASSSIEWYDSPKFVPDNVNTLRSKLAQVKRLESEQKFNADFDKWFAIGNEGNDVCLSSRRADETANDDIDVTPPVLRIRYGALRPHSSRASSYTPARFSNNDSDVDEASGLTDLLKEAKNTIRRLIEKKRHTSSGSSSPRMRSPNGAQIKAIACVVKGEDVAHESNLPKEEPRVNEIEVKVVGKGSCSSGGRLKSDALDPCTSSHIDTSVGGGVSRMFIHFGKGDQEPSPIISVASRKRKRFLDFCNPFIKGEYKLSRKNLPKVMMRKGDDMEVSTSSDEDIGPLESTPLSSHRVSIVREHIEGTPVSSSPLAEWAFLSFLSRKNLPKVMMRKGDDMEVSTSSDEDIGPVESTPLSSHRVSIVREHIEGTPVSSCTLWLPKKYIVLFRGSGEGTAYDSMDDEAVNVLLSQMPIEPHLHPPKTKCPDSTDARPLPDNIVNTQSFQKDSCATSKPKICVTKKICASRKIHNERTPLRRWRTSDASPQGDMKTGGWSRRMTAIAGGSDARREKANEEGGEAMPRSASFEPEKCDSFWDDDEFEGVDFNAIDAVQYGNDQVDLANIDLADQIDLVRASSQKSATRFGMTTSLKGSTSVLLTPFSS
uniref:Uncharacterized protein n=1 Tax=Ascaris lumbricoides TaxID=6252 RepID=A0A9J2PRD0_ASCLU